MGMGFRGAGSHTRSMGEPFRNPLEVVFAIEQRGGRIWADAGRLRFRMPPGRPVSIELLWAIKRHEPALIARLAALEIDHDGPA